MKRIAIFCDGTWQREDQESPSNVARLASALAPADEEGTAQRGLYVRGVGAAGGEGLGGQIDRLAGGAFGWGLDANIEAAYRALLRIHEPGDEVFVFGFSRGAYTARSLVGLIRRAGIMAPVHAGEVGEAMELYRRRITGDPGRDERGRPRTVPDRPEFLQWRAARSPLAATSAYEIAWRRENGLRTPDQVVELAYLGVWDTVGALGVPGHFTAAPLFNRRYEFHDTALSSMVRRARHAVAVDERRLSFEPTLWTNMGELNRKALKLPPNDDLSLVSPAALPYRQEWFPGDHGCVGGGVRRGLSSYALAWVAEGAAAAGLAFRPESIADVERARNIRDELLSRSSRGFARLWRLGDRVGPDVVGDVSAAVRERLRAFADYAPGSLARVMALLRAEGVTRVARRA